MVKVTIVKNYRKSETLKAVSMPEVVKAIQTGQYAEEVEAVRRLLMTTQLTRLGSGSAAGAPGYTDALPRAMFAVSMKKRSRRRVRDAYNGLVLLEVNNLTCHDEAVAIRRGAALMPQTLMAFVGASGRSVKVVCRGELVGGGLPVGDEAIGRFHLNLYEKARLAYNAQLGVVIDKLEPHLERVCYLSADAQAVYNPQAVPFYTDTSEVEQALRPLLPADSQPDELLPGYSRYQAMRLIYEFNLTKAYDDAAGIADDDERHALIVTRLAGYCCETGLDMAFAQRQLLFNLTLGQHPGVVRKTFENAYRERHERGYRRRMAGDRQLRHIPAETLLAMQVDMFLNANYELRRNVMRGVVECRVRSGLGFAFQDLTEEMRNSITMRAMAQGIRCWDKDIRRYVNSDDIARYDPIGDFLERLPQWDGRDRVAALARRVQTGYADWPRLFHVWLRSVVAMWLGKGQLAGNALVPLLIGPQGCGKSSFCRLLLPRVLRAYYNDRVNFRNESDLNLGLTSFALINLDEFDRITARQQVVLKYLVSTADLKFRPPYGKAYSSYRRYASFIGTTNEPMPLSDPTGSRRFVCVPVEGRIDFTTPVDYAQLYAQLKCEVEQRRERYYLTGDEEAQLMRHNLQFQKICGLGEMLMAVIERPQGTPKTHPDGGRWLSLRDISDRLKQVFHGAYQESEGAFIKIGQWLSRPECRFERERKTYGWCYWVKERQ